MQASYHETPRGPHISVLHENGARRDIVIPRIDQGSALFRPLANFAARFGDYVRMINTANDQLQSSYRAEHLRPGAVNVGVAKAFQDLQSATRKEAQKVATARAVAMEVPPATHSTAPLRDRMLMKWDAADLAGKAAMINDPDLPTEGLASLIESGAYKEVPAEIQRVIADRWMTERHIQRVGLQADFQKQPDFHNPIATGPDIEAARAFARNAVANLNAQSEAVETVADALRGSIGIVALATELPDENAYRLITTGNIAA